MAKGAVSPCWYQKYDCRELMPRPYSDYRRSAYEPGADELFASGSRLCAAHRPRRRRRDRNSLKGKPDLIICDIQMPQMDGYEVARSLNSAAHHLNVPLVAVTALAMVGDRDRILAAGFKG